MNYIYHQASRLFPGYFAFIMATGALAIACHLLGVVILPTVLLYLDIIAYTWLWLLTIIRLIKYPKFLLADFMNHSIGPGFFTIVAATGVIGSELIILTEAYLLGGLFWILAILLWIVLIYGFFTAITIKKEKPALEFGINGAWLIAVAATQSISVLSALMVPKYPAFTEEILFFSLAMFLLGCMLYLNIITLIFYGLIFLKVEHSTLTPPYWINMGAIAISTLAGSSLILSAGEWSFLAEIDSFLKGSTLFFWVSGTWWIPLLVILGIWRHFYKKHPLSYDPQLWGMVFPLAMYTLATTHLARALELEFLMGIPRVFLLFAVSAWLAIFIEMTGSIFSNLKNPQKS